MEEGFNLALGARLRAARRHQGLSLTEVERISNQEFKASVLGAYERGERALSVHRLSRLASIYGMPAHQLMPPDSGRAVPAEKSETIDLDSISGVDQSVVVERFLSSIHLMRSGEKSPMAVRSSDMAILNSMLNSLADSPSR